MILLSWQAQEYEDNTGEGDGGAGGQCYLIAHERGAGSMREQGAGFAPARGNWGCAAPEKQTAED